MECEEYVRKLRNCHENILSSLNVVNNWEITELLKTNPNSWCCKKRWCKLGAVGVERRNSLDFTPLTPCHELSYNLIGKCSQIRASMSLDSPFPQNVTLRIAAPAKVKHQNALSHQSFMLIKIYSMLHFISNLHLQLFLVHKFSNEKALNEEKN